MDVYRTFRDELKTGRDEALMNEIRAKNLYAAAILERTNGMELFGTEMEPDWEIYGGNFGWLYLGNPRDQFLVGNHQ